jgi:hypothetical protein
LFWRQPATFRWLLHGDLDRWARRAERSRKRLFIRLNALADIEWERIDPTIFTRHPDVFFYDYTKIASRVFNRSLPANYKLVLSRSEYNDPECLAALRSGHSVAVVFRKAPLPPTWKGFAVVDGTRDDLRPCDPAGVVVGLLALGRARFDNTGFVVDSPTHEE